MITSEFLRTEIAASRATQRTSQFLRQFVLRVVDQSLRRVYGDNYSIYCLQASIAIREMLKPLGIRSHVIAGAACFSRASKGNPFEVGWGGFWGDEHHVWVVTEFRELVDLTISQLDVHPAMRSGLDEPIPALWWYPLDSWPPVIRYLPRGVAQPELPEEDANKLEGLLADLAAAKREVLDTSDHAHPLFESMLHGLDGLQEMTMAGYPWAVKSLKVQDDGIPFPPWVIAREEELMAESLARQAED